MGDIAFHPVGPELAPSLARLFASSRSARHCWCTAYCSGWAQFALGWYGGGNRRHFEHLAATQGQPMGVLAVREHEPVGWCACGPRRRYTAALRGRSALLAGRDRAEDDAVWLIACVFVAPSAAGSGVAVSLLREGVALADSAGARAVEAWPVARGVRQPAYAHLGREAVFERLGFSVVDRPSPGRVMMRRELR